MERERELIERLASEAAHELAAPVAFFRQLFGALSDGAAIEAEDLSIAREEAERLGRILNALRRVRPTDGADLQARLDAALAALRGGR